MNDSDFQFLAAELNLPENRIRKVAALFEDGATVPFIARYRKERCRAAWTKWFCFACARRWNSSGK